MFFRALRSVTQPVSRTMFPSRSLFNFPITSSPVPARDRHLLRPFLGIVGGIPASNAAFHSARWRATPEGPVRKRDVQKGMKQQHRAIVASERKKLKAQVEEAFRRERENWDEKRIEKYWLNYLKPKEMPEEAKRPKEIHICGRNWRETRRHMLERQQMRMLEREQRRIQEEKQSQSRFDLGKLDTTEAYSGRKAISTHWPEASKKQNY